MKHPKMTQPNHVRCPCLNCGFIIWFNYGPKEIRLDEKQALDKLIQHLKTQHTVGEIFEWLERCVVSYFDQELKSREKVMRLAEGEKLK